MQIKGLETKYYPINEKLVKPGTHGIFRINPLRELVHFFCLSWGYELSTRYIDN